MEVVVVYFQVMSRHLAAEKNYEKLSHNSQSTGQNLNSRRLEYEAFVRH
jgi:hypothetical protein